jgi:hypothetical protein
MIAANEFGLDRCNDSGATQNSRTQELKNSRTQELKNSRSQGMVRCELGARPSAFSSNLRNLWNLRFQIWNLDKSAVPAYVTLMGPAPFSPWMGPLHGWGLHGWGLSPFLHAREEICSAHLMLTHMGPDAHGACPLFSSP